MKKLTKLRIKQLDKMMEFKRVKALKRKKRKGKYSTARDQELMFGY